MKTFNFVLILEGFNELNREVEDRLYEAGCDDALLGMRGATPFLEFDREAKSIREAVVSAIRDVESAGYAVVAVEPDDLVSVAEIAERMGRTRQSAAQLVDGSRGPGGFPSPVHGIDSRVRLWRWGDVLEWLMAFDSQAISPEAPSLEFTRLVAAINGALVVRRYEGKQGGQLLREIGAKRSGRSDGHRTRAK
jgi:hypothetical protein